MESHQIERIEGLTSTSLIESLEQVMEDICQENMEEGFEPEELEKYLIYKVRQVIKKAKEQQQIDQEEQ